jgi:hypothetical protein
MNKLLGQSGEDINRGDVENLSFAFVALVSVVQKWSSEVECIMTDEFRRMTPTRMVR